MIIKGIEITHNQNKKHLKEAYKTIYSTQKFVRNLDINTEIKTLT